MVPFKVYYEAYKIAVLSRVHVEFYANDDVTIDIACCVREYYLQYISFPQHILNTIYAGEGSVVAPLPRSTINEYKNMVSFIPLYKFYLKLTKRNKDKPMTIDTFINFSRYNLSKSDKFICDCCSYFSGINYFIFEVFSYIVRNLRNWKDYMKLCEIIDPIEYIFDENVKSMLSMKYSCLYIKEDVIMRKTLEQVDKLVPLLQNIDSDFEPVLEQNPLYTYLYRICYFMELFERVEDRWCPYKYLAKNINSILNHNIYDPSYKKVLKAVNENTMKNGGVDSIKCKDCNYVQDPGEQDLTVYNDKEVDGVFTTMRQILIDLYTF